MRFIFHQVLYRAADSVVPATCLSPYASQVRTAFNELDRALSARCSAISVDMNVTFSDSDAHLVEDDLVEVSYIIQIAPAVRQPQLYDLCGSTLGLVFDLSISTSAVLAPLLEVGPLDKCPIIKAVNSTISRGFACGTGQVLNHLVRDKIRKSLSNLFFILKKGTQHGDWEQRTTLLALSGGNLGCERRQDVHFVPAWLLSGSRPSRIMQALPFGYSHSLTRIQNPRRVSPLH